MTRSLVIDTSVFSEVLRNNPFVNKKLLDEMSADARVLMSAVVYYEIKRGLLKRDTRRMMEHFEAIIAPLPWIDMTRSDWDEAARLWAKSQRTGLPREDADLLIAAQANQRGAVVVTDNVDHFKNTANEWEQWS